MTTKKATVEQLQNAEADIHRKSYTAALSAIGKARTMVGELREPAPVEPPAPTPEPEPAPPVKEPTDLEKLLAAAGVTERVRYDDCTDPEPRNLYGEGLPYDYTAVSRIGKGTFEGQPARTCTVLEGDHAGNSNAFRTEVGHDENRYGLATVTAAMRATIGRGLHKVRLHRLAAVVSGHMGTFWLYREGDHTVTVARRELPGSFKLSSGEFQTVFQIKQSNPGSESLTGNEVGPALEIEARNGRWILSCFWKELWSCPAHLSVPTTFVVETVHSKETSKGSVRLSVLENGKLVAQSETFKCANLSKVTGNPGHYRGGLYMSLKATPVPVTVVHGATEIWKAV